MKQLNADDVRLEQTYKASEFARVIAKIAYSYAVAVGQIEGPENAPVVDSILGKTEDIGRWVGAFDDPLVQEPRVLHSVTLRRFDELGFLVGVVKLFADSLSPMYGVLLRRLN